MLNFRTFDLNLLRVFDAVMTERHLTRAAERLAMTQPAVSNALKRLRESIGDDLLVRTATGMRSTPVADALWPEIKMALGRLQNALAPDTFDPQRDAQIFQLSMADVTAAMLMPGLMQRMEQEKALVNLRVIPLTTRDPRALLERGEADMAVGYFPDAIAALSGQGDMAYLHHRRLYESEYVCVMRKDHRLAQPDALTLDEFCAAQHLLVSFSGRAHGFVDAALAALGRTRRVVLTVNQFFTAGRVVKHTNLLTVLPRSFVPATGYAEHLVQQPLPLKLAPVHVEALWHARLEHHAGHRWLREKIFETAQNAIEFAKGPDNRKKSPKVSPAPGLS